MLLDLELSTSLLICLIPLLLLFFVNNCKSILTNLSSSKSSKVLIPKSYPLIGSFFGIIANRNRNIQWTSDLVRSSPTSTFVLHRPLGRRQVFTGNPSNVQHILKTHFHIYQKSVDLRRIFQDFLGNGILIVDGESWKFQRQVSSHEFSTKSLRKFVENVVETELSTRLLPILATSAANRTVLDFQDILQRFAFDNMCNIAFGYDPAYLLPSLPLEKFARAIEDTIRILGERFNYIFPIIWKIKWHFNIGSEKQLSIAIARVREFAREILKEKKRELDGKSSLDSVDLLSRFLCTGQAEENFVIDIIINFMVAGRNTTSAALTWFFWLLSNNPHVEKEILKEIREKSEAQGYDELKEMVYTHASLCESMRLCPPFAMSTKEAISDDILPDGTVVKKGMKVTYHPYAMGRVEKLWGADWAEYRPGRWLEKDVTTGKLSFVARDSYTYPVFQAGPRICLGKEMAFLQMKRVAAGVLRQFRVVPVVEEGVEPVSMSRYIARMKGGFRVRIEERADSY